MKIWLSVWHQHLANLHILKTGIKRYLKILNSIFLLIQTTCLCFQMAQIGKDEIFFSATLIMDSQLYWKVWSSDKKTILNNHTSVNQCGQKKHSVQFSNYTSIPQDTWVANLVTEFQLSFTVDCLPFHLPRAHHVTCK